MLLVLGLGPLCLPPCSEQYGRFVVCLVSFSLFRVLTADRALAPNIASLAVLKFLCGMAGSAGPALGAGTVSDIFAPERRSRA